VTCPLPLEGTTKADVTRMVEVTVMVYRFIQEQHKLDSSLPKQHQEPLILQDVKRHNEFALALCRRFGIPERDSNASIATLSVQCGDQTTLYLEGTQLEPQCFSCHVDNKTIQYIMTYGLCTSMYKIRPLVVGSELVMCFPFASLVVTT
jgi:hypothetical protein